MVVSAASLCTLTSGRIIFRGFCEKYHKVYQTWKLILAKYQEKYLKIENEMLKADNNDISDFSFFSC